MVSLLRIAFLAERSVSYKKNTANKDRKPSYDQNEQVNNKSKMASMRMVNKRIIIAKSPGG